MPVVVDDDVLVQVRAAGVDQGVWHLMAGLPSADGPAAWKIWPSGRLPSLGCTAAIDASYCSFVPPGNWCTTP